jgi:hypothetical protein
MDQERVSCFLGGVTTSGELLCRAQCCFGSLTASILQTPLSTDLSSFPDAQFTYLTGISVCSPSFYILLPSATLSQVSIQKLPFTTTQGGNPGGADTPSDKKVYVWFSRQCPTTHRWVHRASDVVSVLNINLPSPAP